MATSDGSGIACDVAIPHSGLAEEVLVLEWLVADGESVVAGSPLVLIESEKTQIEIDAPGSGRLEIILVASEAEVAVGTTIGRIWS